MKTAAMGLFFVLVLTAASGNAERDASEPAQDVEVSGTIVDGLDRPIPGATVAFSYYTGPHYELKKVPLLPSKTVRGVSWNSSASSMTPARCSPSNRRTGVRPRSRFPHAG